MNTQAEQIQQNSKPRLPRKLAGWSGSLIVSLSASCLLLSSCGGVKDEEVKEADFGGLKSLTENTDGTWNLSWDVAADQSPVYLIYRAPKGTQIDFNAKPYFSVPETSWTTEVLFFQPEYCFVVRASTATFVTDENTNTLCTERRDLSFEGIQAGAQDSNGSYILTWNAIPLPGIRYSVYSRPAGESSIDRSQAIPLDVTDNTVYDAGVLDRGNSQCFWVTVDTSLVEIDIPNNLFTNESPEKCSDEEDDLVFAGIDSLDFGTEPLTMVITWKAAQAGAISEYRIYEGAQGETREATVAAEDPDYFDESTGVYTYIVATPSANRIYHWSVRAADGVGREDTNTSTKALRANTEFVK